MNVLNGVWIDTNILQVIIQQRPRKVDKDFAKELGFKDIKLSVKIRDVQKLKKRITSTLVFLVTKIKRCEDVSK